MQLEILPDGLEALRREMGLPEIMNLIERTARWVDRETFEYLPIWYPEHSRRSLFYKANWSEPQMNKNRSTGVSVHKSEGNVHANKALTLALGLRHAERPNWSCCHIWGIDDATYQVSNAVVQDPRFFSCIGNMVLLPTPLKAFTDVMADVKVMLRVCARHLYGWSCDHEAVGQTVEKVGLWADWEAYPTSWPRPGMASSPLGLMPFTRRVKAAADRRLAGIRRDLAFAGPHYPRAEVLKALEYWNVKLSPQAKPSRRRNAP